MRGVERVLDLVLMYAAGDEESLLAVLDARMAAQLTGGDYSAQWAELKALQQRICLRVLRGEGFAEWLTREGERLSASPKR